jgi:3-hydroxyacyl-CoA dehydrogenase/enoyl-CoA hydratase/3-hydroxybutyryl-CoA epimerase
MSGRFLRTERDDELAIWWLDQQDARHNTLSSTALDELGVAIEGAAADAHTHAIVIISGKPDSFVTGADVREVQSFRSREEALALSRRGHQMILRVRHLDKPVVAAIHGAALGGGLELALACSMRIATDHAATRFALPEVMLGLVPGGGGTQLLPRLVGLQRSLPMLLTGKNAYPRPAKKMGLIDALIHRPGLLEAAKSAARDLVSGRIKQRGGGPEALQERLFEKVSVTRRVIYARAAERVRKETHGKYPAPPRILECVRVGIEEGMEAGLDREASAFADLSMTAESEELVRLFFARNAAENNPLEGHQRPVQHVGILGAGLMGSGIAEVSAENGLNVVVKDRSLELSSKSRKHVHRSASRKVEKHAMTPFERDAMVERVTAAADYEPFARVDLVIEAAPEDLELKKQLIAEVDRATKPDCILASNTSSIPIASLADAASRREQVIGMHYFSPVAKMPLLEVVRTPQTADWVLATAIETGLRQGKTIIVVHDGPGFYTTRILALYMNEALDLLVDGAQIETVDRSLREFGFPMGPFELFDLVGIDVTSKIMDVLGGFFADRGIEPNHRAAHMVDAGMTGRKAGVGFYIYEDGVRAEANKDAYRFFTAGGGSSPEAPLIRRRLVLALVNEAVRCLEDGILRSASDGDVGAVFGLGFPPFLGGPFRYVDREGPGRIVDRLRALETVHGKQFTPSDHLRTLAAQGGSFYQENDEAGDGPR